MRDRVVMLLSVAFIALFAALAIAGGRLGTPQRREGAREKLTNRGQIVAMAQQTKANAKAAQSVPALRIEVARLAELVEALAAER